MNRKSKFQVSYGAIGAIVLMLACVGPYPAEANVGQIKLYKEAFPGTKPSCLFCHLDKIPKKDDGMHDLSAYGAKVKETDEEVTAESYTKVGAYEDFKEESPEAPVE